MDSVSVQSFIPLSSSKHLGGKADGLGIMTAAGFRVPQGVVVPHQFLLDVLRANDQLDEFVRLQTESGVMYRFDKLHDLIQGVSFSEEMTTQISQLLTLGDRLIVRSSASNEDSQENSLAGLFESYVTDEHSVDQLIHCLKACWSHAYSNQVYVALAEFPEEVNLVVQAYVAFDKSGVAFSANPVTGDKSEIIIETVEGNSSKLVDGLQQPEEHILEKDANEFAAGKLLSSDELKQLRDCLLQLRDLFQFEVDVEWGFQGNELILVQCRPIVWHQTRVQVATGSWIAADDLATLRQADMADCEEMYHRFFKKKYWVRSILKSNGKRLSEYGYFFFDPATLTKEQIEQATRNYSSGVIHLKTDKWNQLAHNQVDELYRVFTSPTFPAGYHVVMFEEFAHTDNAGYSMVTPDGNVFVETIRGGFSGLWNDGLSPSRYVLTPDGEVVLSELNEVPYYFVLDKPTLEHKKFNLDTPAPSKLSPEDLREVASITCILDAAIGNVSIEWTCSEAEGIRFFDMSQESTSKVQFNPASKTLSPGDFEGPVVLVDAFEFESMFENKFEVNVVETDEYREKTNSKEFKDRIFALVGHEKPVVITEFPNRTLAPLVPYVSGFIFKQGAVLCHLSIILREHGVPAIVDKDVPELTAGTTVTVQNGVFQVLVG